MLDQIGQDRSDWLREALSWTESMCLPNSATCYRLHAGAEPTVFASCFALFFLHLCGATEKWYSKRKEQWIDYIQGFQEKATGLFVDPAARARVTDPSHDSQHLDLQLTGLCLAALRVLGTRARHPIRYGQSWGNRHAMEKWLGGLDWKRSSNSGNKAMFIAIILIDEIERGNSDLQVGLDAWFEWHDRNANQETNFWGETDYCQYFQGMKGFVHQLVIYNYMGRKVLYPTAAIDRTLLLQQQDGLFSPMLGGGSCDDLDAVHILCHFYHEENHRRADITCALGQAYRSLLANQNPDGGFCWAHRRRFSFGDWNGLKGLKFLRFFKKFRGLRVVSNTLFRLQPSGKEPQRL